MLATGRKGFTSFGILNLPVLVLVLLIWLNEVDLVIILTILVHFQGLVGVQGDDLEGILLSLDWGEFPLGLGAVCLVVCLGDGTVLSVVSDDLNLAVLLIVESKTVEFVIPALLDNKDLVPGLTRLLFKADHGGLVLSRVPLLASGCQAVIKHLPIVDILNVNLGLAAENGGTTSGLLMALDALVLGVVPESGA